MALHNQPATNPSVPARVLWLSCLRVSALAFILLAGCKSLQKDPISESVVTARQMSLRGLESMQQEQWQEAEAWFANAVQINPADERAHVQYAELLWRRGAIDEAITNMQQAVKLSGGDPTLQVRLGEMYLVRGDEQLAVRQASGAIETNRQLACAWALQGDIHRQQGELSEAIADYHRSLSHEGHCPHVQLALAAIYRQQGRPRRALSTLESLAQHYAPDEMPQGLLYEQGLALKELGRYGSAVDTLTKASEQGSPSADLLFHLAEARMMAGDITNARLAVIAALTEDPNHPGSHQLRDEIEEQQRRLTAAMGRY